VREIEELLTFIPAEELRLQWDVCWEVLNLEGVTPWVPDSDHWTRYTEAIAELSRGVPDSVGVGYHLCYGNWEARHMVEPPDLGLCVRMANAAVEHAAHDVAFFHMPMPIDRDDDAYFAPLRDLRTGSARIYLGLVHAHDGLEGAARWVASAPSALQDFGVATECGMGYVPEPELDSVPRLHRDISNQLLGGAGAAT
jgi:methionine synthase II (cobalamin-independent)